MLCLLSYGTIPPIATFVSYGTIPPIATFVSYGTFLFIQNAWVWYGALTNWAIRKYILSGVWTHIAGLKCVQFIAASIL